MTFSQSKHTLLLPQKEKKLFTFLVALFTAACLFVPYMIMSEGYFTFYGDFNVQQIPFYQMCHQAIRTGDVNWNWLTDLGSDFIGSYAFYLLGSPFFWITLIFPNSFVPYLMGPLLILKFACAALTGYLYIRRFTKTAYAASLGGLLYAFSGFSIYNIFFNHFHEAIIAFPLLLMAMELLITENRRGVFALAVAFCAITNYFFFFGMVVFCVIYFFVRLFSKAIRVKLSRFLVLLFEAVLGLLLSAALLLPALNAVIGNDRVSEILMGWNGITYGKEQIYLNVIQCFFFPPDLPARPVFFPDANVKWSSLGGWLPVFSMTGFFTWFKLREKSWLKRVLAICVLFAMVPILNSAFYAFNVSYYARWFYMPVLMIDAATVILTEDSTVNWSSGFRWNAAITLAFMLVIGFFPQKNSDGEIIFGLYTQSSDGTYVLRFWITCLIAMICVLLQKPLFTVLKSNRVKFYKTAVACVCAVSILYGNIFIALGRTHSYDVKDVMIDSLIEGEVYLDDESEFRIDVYDGVDNTGMYLGYPSINAFHSVVSPSIMEFYDYIGIERSVASRPDTDYSAIRPLLSVKYLLNRVDGDNFVDDYGETEMPGYKYLKTSGNYYVYENENYIPYGFSYDYYMSCDFCDDYSKDNISRLMLKAILLTDEQIEKYGDYMTDISTLKSGGIYTGGENSLTKLSFTDEAMAADCTALRETSADSFTIDNNGFSTNVTRDKKSLVFFSVPYDDGWTAYVNGKQACVEKVNSGFMAVAVDAGESEIRFNYRNTYLDAGILITITACVILILYVAICLLWFKKRPMGTEYPEGEKLLEQWCTDDIIDTFSNRENEPEQEESQKSILSSLEDEILPTKNNELLGGFIINQDALNEENDDEA